MITTIKDDEGKVIAYGEWSLRDKLGLEDKQGLYVYIHNIWIHGQQRNNGMLRKLINLIEPHVPTARSVYFQRGKYNKRLSIYSEKQILKLRGV